MKKRQIALFVLLLSASPLLSQTHLNVDDFPGGSKPNDDTVMIQNALDRAKTLSGAVVVHFKAKKTYFVSKRGGGTPGVMPWALSIHQSSTITLEGHGAELRCTDRDSIILSVTNSRSIRVRELRFDYYPCQFTQGRIVSVDTNNKTFELKIDSGHAQLNDPWFVPPSTPRPFVHHAIHLQANRDEWVYDSAAHVWLKWQPKQTARGTWVCESGHRGRHYAWYEELDVAKLRVGHRIVVAGLWGEKGTKPAGYPTLFYAGVDCALDSCLFYNGEAFTQCFEGTRMTVSKCKFVPRKGDAPEGVDRIWAGVGCGALFEHMQEGPRVLDCEIRCVPDDIMNFNCPPLLCYESVRNYADAAPHRGASTMRFGGWIGPDTVEVGDRLAITDGTTGQTKATVVVESLNWEGPFLRVQLHEWVPLVKVVGSRTSCLHYYSTTADKIENLDASNRNAVIRGNIFDTCGNFLRIPKLGAVIENNVFRNIAETPIMGEVNPFVWLDWPRPHGIKIHNNRFTNCQWSLGFHDQTMPNWHQNDRHRLFRNGIIHLSFIRWGAKMTEPIVRDIEITDNVIEGWGQSAIRIEGATIETRTSRNKIDGNVLVEKPYAHPKRFLKSTDRTWPLYIANSRETDLTNTKVTLLSNSTAGAVVRIRPDCEKSINTSFDPQSQIPAGMRWVADERTSSGPPPRVKGAIVTMYGDGCIGCNGPQLGANDLPAVGEPFTLKIDRISHLATGGFYLGAAPDLIPLSLGRAPECILRVSTIYVLPTPNMAGEMQLSLSIPNVDSLRGVAIYAQGYVTDPTKQTSFMLTNALRAVIGKR